MGAGIWLVESMGSAPLLAQMRTRLSIGTAGTKGVFYPLGVGIAALISKYIPGTEATAEVTGGSKDNMKLLHTGQIQLALVVPDIAWEAAQGKLKEVPEKVAVRTLLVTYSGRLHIVTLEGSGIRTVADLKGKRVSMGPPGGGSESAGLLVFEAYGITPQDLGSHLRLGYAESATALKEGKLDAFLFDGGIPGPVIRELVATSGIKMKLIPHGDVAPKLAAKYPFYFSMTIPKGTYTGVDEDVSVVARAVLFVAHERLDERLGYEVTKVILERTEELVAAHVVAKEITLRSAVVGSPIPFHPGAVRYYKEKGVTVPSS
jgi:TRAP transporter TAXI family solute receptor